MDSEYVTNLKARKCTTPTDTSTIVEMDPGSRNTFDLSYYSLLVKRRGLFESDAALTMSPVTFSLVKQLLHGSLDEFYSEFAKSMEKLSQINVKTRSEGEIRKKCSIVNG